MRKALTAGTTLCLLFGVLSLVCPQTALLREGKLIIKGITSAAPAYFINGVAYVPLTAVQKLYDEAARSDGKDVYLLAAPETPAKEAGGQPASDTPISPRVKEIETECFRLQNEFRGMNRREALALDEGLQLVARKHSEDMLNRNYFAHKAPDGSGPADRKLRYYPRLFGGFGENIFTMSGSYLSKSTAEIAAIIVKGWEDSPAHRENMLNAGFTHGGIAVAMSDNTLMATCNFSPEFAVIDEPLPEVTEVGARFKVTGEVRGNVPVTSLEGYLGIPDASAKCPVPEGGNSYTIGGCFLKAKRVGERRFEISFETNKGPGVYEFQLGQAKDGKHSFYGGWKILAR